MKKVTFVMVIFFFLAILAGNAAMGQIFQFSYQGGAKELVLYPGESGNTVSPVKPGGGNTKQAADFYVQDPKWGNITVEMGQRIAVAEKRKKIESLSEMAEVLKNKDKWKEFGVDTTLDFWKQEMLVFGSRGGEPALVSVPSKKEDQKFYIVTLWGKPWIRLQCFNPFYAERVVEVESVNEKAAPPPVIPVVDYSGGTEIIYHRPDAVIAAAKAQPEPTATLSPSMIEEVEEIPWSGRVRRRNLWIIPAAAIGATGITYGVVKLLKKDNNTTPPPPVVPPNTGGPGSGGNNTGGPGSGGKIGKVLDALKGVVQAIASIPRD